MSLLFNPIKIGNVEIKNRFIHSATYEVMAKETGEVTAELIKRYDKLVKGEVGLIIPGYMYIHPLGRAYTHQTGIHKDDMIPGLKKLTDTVHKGGGKIIFQIVHAGRNTKKSVIGQQPMGPSGKRRDPMNFQKPRELKEEEIFEIIRSFGKAAKRAVEAGADGIQLHGAHGYLINQFLSPFLNLRKDTWGGSDENRFRFLKETVIETRKSMPEGMPLLVKMNTNDYTPKIGIVPELAVTYAKWLAELGIDGLEVSCGNGEFSPFNIFRGEVPVNELLLSLPNWKKPLGKLMLKGMAGKFDLGGAYNVEAARMIKPVMGNIPLFVVGGLRKVSQMEDVLSKGYADCISMSRPFIKQPFIVKQFKERKAGEVSCISCNKCVAAVLMDMPVHCYQKGFPSSK